MLSMVMPYFPHMVYAVGLTGPLGMTLIISMASDLLSILTSSIYVSYFCAAGIFSLQLTMAGSLFNLFRGDVEAHYPSVVNLMVMIL
jgi:phosphatidylinositol N-acetylglucosaminyltransferase subunit Q